MLEINFFSEVNVDILLDLGVQQTCLFKKAVLLATNNR